MNKVFDTLYKRDSKGKVRAWYMEQEGDKYRTFDGIYGGTVKASAWRTAKPTNVGRSNERDGVVQATFEIEASYTKQLKGSYYTDIADIDQGCRYTEPMLAEKYSGFLPGFAQPKLDGVRCIIKAGGAFSREGEILPGAGHIVRALAPVFAKLPDLILDGELYNHELKDDFNELMSLIKKGSPPADRLAEIEAKVQYHVYDILSHEGPFADRASRLEILVHALGRIHPGGHPIHLVETVSVTAPHFYDALHGRWVEAGYEGSMWRCPTTRYEQGKRSKGLLKRKDFDDAEFDVVRIEEGEGNWAGAAKRVVCWLPGADRSVGPNKDNTFEAGLRGSYGANQKLLAEAGQQKVVTIRFFGWTPSAIPKPRFGVATKWHGAARTL